MCSAGEHMFARSAATWSGSPAAAPRSAAVATGVARSFFLLGCSSVGTAAAARASVRTTARRHGELDGPAARAPPRRGARARPAVAPPDVAPGAARPCPASHECQTSAGGGSRHSSEPLPWSLSASPPRAARPPGSPAQRRPATGALTSRRRPRPRPRQRRRPQRRRPRPCCRPRRSHPPRPPPPQRRTTTAPPAPEDDGTLELGESGDAVLALQQRLSELGYWLGTPDGNYGQLTRQAVMAFQKVEGLTRDGVAGPATRQRLATAGRPTA